jgi:hypothetical protein
MAEKTAAFEVLKSNIERLIRLQGSDAGFFVLAVHSLVEGILRERYTPPCRDDDNFFWLIDSFREDLISNADRFIKNLDVLNLLCMSHQRTNDVRHQFKPLSKEDARTATQHICRFLPLAGVDGQQRLGKLTNSLKAWDEKRCSAELIEELGEKGFKLHMTSRENKELQEKVRELAGVEAQLVHAEKELSLFESKLAVLAEQKNKKDEKVDSLRQELFGQKQRAEQEALALQERLRNLEEASEYVNNLRRATLYTRSRFDYERTVTRLTKEQKRVLEQIRLDRHFLVKGSAGTGKSLVLLKAIERAKGADAESLGLDMKTSAVLLTYTNSLVKYDRYIAELLSGENPADRVMTADSFLLERLRELEEDASVDYNIAGRLAEKYPVEGMNAKELAAETEQYLWGNAVDGEDYVSGTAGRRGMKIPLTRQQREAVWSAVVCMEEEMDETKVYSKNYSRLKLLRHHDADPEDSRFTKMDYLFIDEVQDLSAADLKALSLFADRAMIMAGDSDQSIYQPSFSFKRAGVNIVGNSRILRTNFRNTLQLQETAEQYRATLPKFDAENSPEAFRPGPPPELFTGADKTELTGLLLDRIDLFVRRLEYDPENICVLVPMNSDIAYMQENIRERGYDAESIKEGSFDFTSRGRIRLSTMHSCKGLDFPVVLLFLHRPPYCGGPFDTDTRDKMTRNLIYVSITRAMDHLNVFCKEDTSSQPIGDLTGLFE